MRGPEACESVGSKKVGGMGSIVGEGPLGMKGREIDDPSVDEVLKACWSKAKEKIGILILMIRHSTLYSII